MERKMSDILELARVSVPSLYLRGDQEPKALYSAEDFAGRTKGVAECASFDCNHSYAGREDVVSTLFCRWLAML